MNTRLLTVEHEFHVHGVNAVLCAAGGVSVHNSLDATADILESVVAGLQTMMSAPEASSNATLICFAADSALALVYAAQAGASTPIDVSETVAREAGGRQ